MASSPQKVHSFVFVTEKGRVLLIHNDPTKQKDHGYFAGIPLHCLGFLGVLEKDPPSFVDVFSLAGQIAKELLGFVLHVVHHKTVSLYSTMTLPRFSMGETTVSHWIVFVEEKDIAHSQLFWEHPTQIIRAYKEFSLLITPETLDVLKSLVEATDLKEVTEFSRKLIYLPSIKCIPIPSSTLPPFDHTNLIIVKRQKEALIVDPGSNNDLIKNVLEELRDKKLSKLIVFITHHHHDHIEGLTSVNKIFGKDNVLVLAHPLSIARIGGFIQDLKCEAVNHGDKIQVADYVLQVIGSPGHTDGSISLYHSNSGALIVGDHLVGFGSSVLDITSGGDMSEYLDTCRKMISLSPLKIIFPAHGPPNYAPKLFLQKFMDHRMEREAKILKLLEENPNPVTTDFLLERVYSEVPKIYWDRALSNLLLHIRKLINEKVIEEDRITNFIDGSKL